MIRGFAIYADKKNTKTSPLTGKHAEYVFGRERAVQPFDRYSHTSPPGEIVGPFLTKYGYHVLQVTGYAQDPLDPTKDETTVRHVLVMYPSLKKIDDADGDIRAHIRELVAAAAVEALEPGLENLLPAPAVEEAAPAAAEPVEGEPESGGEAG